MVSSGAKQGGVNQCMLSNLVQRMGILDVDRVVGFVESKVLSLQAKL